MPEITVTDTDFYLKEGLRKPHDAAVELLLGYREAVGAVMDVDNYVFLHSSGTSHEIWQITDLDAFERQRDDIIASADALLAGRAGRGTFSAGRLLTFDAPEWTDGVKREMIDALIRARWPFQAAGRMIAVGLVTESEWESIREAFVGEIRTNHEEAHARQRAHPSKVVRTAKKLKLDPEPSGRNPDMWQARCPGTSHPIYISREADTWGCGWCKRKGGPEELIAFNAEREEISRRRREARHGL